MSSLLFAITLSARAQTRSVKVLVGGTLIDGFGSKPIRKALPVALGFNADPFSANFSFVMTHVTAGIEDIDRTISAARQPTIIRRLR